MCAVVSNYIEYEKDWWMTLPSSLTDFLLPMLATAGAYLDQATISSSDCVFRLYKDESWAQFIRRPNALLYIAAFIWPWQTTERTFGFKSLIYEIILAKLLPLWAYVDNQDIWFEFLRLGDSDYPEWSLTKEFNFSGALSCGNDGIERIWHSWQCSLVDSLCFEPSRIMI